MAFLQILADQGKEGEFFACLPAPLPSLLANNRGLKERAHILIAEPAYYRSFDRARRNQAAAQRFAAMYDLPASLLPGKKVDNLEDYKELVEVFSGAGFRFILEAGFGANLFSDLDVPKAKVTVKRLAALRDLLVFLGYTEAEWQARLIKDYKTGAIDAQYADHAKRLQELFKGLNLTPKEFTLFKQQLEQNKLEHVFYFMVKYLKARREQKRLLMVLTPVQAALTAVFWGDEHLAGRMFMQKSDKRLLHLLKKQRKYINVPAGFLPHLFGPAAVNPRLAVYILADRHFNHGFRRHGILSAALPVLDSGAAGQAILSAFEAAVQKPQDQALVQRLLNMVSWDEEAARILQHLFNLLRAVRQEFIQEHGRAFVEAFGQFLKNGDIKFLSAFSLDKAVLKNKLKTALRLFKQFEVGQRKEDIIFRANKMVRLLYIPPTIFVLYSSDMTARLLFFRFVSVRRSFIKYLRTISDIRPEDEGLGPLLREYIILSEQAHGETRAAGAA